MDIQVGEYIRTEEGMIRKVKETYLTESGNYLCICTDKYGVFTIGKKDNNSEIKVKKHSFKLVDLIEVGDYVNGEKIIGIDRDAFVKDQINLWTDKIGTNFSIYLYRVKFIEETIKSVVTKEQFESISYKVGE